MTITLHQKVKRVDLDDHHDVVASSGGKTTPFDDTVVTLEIVFPSHIEYNRYLKLWKEMNEN